jgi:hypothetical protein
MTDQPVQPEAPTTKAGRVLLEQEAYNSRSFPLITVEAILAIEAEARAASQPLSQERPPIDVDDLIRNMPVAVLATDGGRALAYAMRVEAYLRARLAGGSVEAAGASDEPQVITGYVNPDGSGEGNWDE